MTATTPDELQAHLSVVLDPAASLEDATFAFYQFRKALEEPEHADLRLSVSVVNDAPPADLFDEIEGEASVEIEPTMEEIHETFGQSPAAPARRDDGPDYWDLAKKRYLNFGKYGPKDPEGPRTYFWVYENDPSWLEWAYDNTDRFDTATSLMVDHMLRR